MSAVLFRRALDGHSLSLIPLSVVLAFLIGYVFWWSLKGGMFDDLEGPAHWILHDDDDLVATQERRPKGDSPSIPRLTG
jgi:cbb3-type cytochrome oxidase maturation protein